MELEYRVIQQEDVKAVTKCLADTFSHSEPMCSTVGITFDELYYFANLFTERAAKEGLSIVACDTENDKIVGCLVSEDLTAQPPVGIENVTEKMEPVLEVLTQLEEQFFQHNQEVRQGEILHMFMGGVYPEYAGKQVLENLALKNEELAKNKGFNKILVELTGKASQIVYKKLNYKELYNIEYNNFKFNGAKPFSGIANHDSCVIASKKIK